jgi:ABC-type transport system involved in cytochrome c biogenesis permease subunit
MGSRVYLLLTLVCYTLGALHVLLQLLRRKPLSNVTLGTTVIGFALHTAGLSQRWTEAGRFPVTGVHDACSFLAWATVLAFLLTYLRTRVDALSLAAYPAAFVLILASNLTRPLEPDPHLDRVLFPVHASLAFLGFAALFVAWAMGILYLMQERELRARSAGRLYYLIPSLERCDTISGRSVMLGFGLLSLAIVSGMALAHQARGEYWLWDAKGISALVAWGTYVVLLVTRWRAGWGGRRQAVLGIGAFLAVVATFAFVTVLGGGTALAGR